MQLGDLKQLNFPRHILSKKKKKKKRGDEEDENEDIFILLAILINDHRNAQGKVSKLELDDLLMFDEECHNQFSEWTNSGAIEQVLSLGGHSRNNRCCVNAYLQLLVLEFTFPCMLLYYATLHRRSLTTAAASGARRRWTDPWPGRR